MNKQELLDSIFSDFRSGRLPEGKILTLSSLLDTKDVPWLMDYVESLNGPEDYFTETNKATHKTQEIIVEGFFKFVDLISLLILQMGDSVHSQLASYANRRAGYVPWVIKYVSDERFHTNLRHQFPFLEA